MAGIRIPIKIILTVLILAFIVYLGIYIRSDTLDSPTVLDYDPWYFYRYAKDIVENNYQIPQWDTLTYYPPGRPTMGYFGWSYTIALMYKVISGFVNISLMEVAKLSPLIMVAVIPIFAFLLGRLLSNTLGGLITALFSVIAPAFIGVSMGGYADSDVVAVFYMFLTVLAIVSTIKYAKNKLASIPLYILSITSVLLFTFNWNAGWLPLILFMAFIPALLVFRIAEEIVHTRKLRVNIKSILPDLKRIIIPLLIIFLITNTIGYFLGFKTMFHAFLGGLAFTGISGERLIVNISVAELQNINIFTRDGFLAVASRVGMLPTIMTLVGLPLLALYKLYKKEKIDFIEIFLFLWALVSFYLIMKGVRFSLLFSTATAVSTGYVIGNLYNYLRSKNLLLFSSVLSIIGALTFVAVSNAMQVGFASGGLSVSQNWYNALDWLKDNADKDALVATWWDPGHIIAGYTGLKVHADGAHCGGCVPYNHDIRIRDMGRIMSTANETESVEIIKKYTHLTDEQCGMAKKSFGDVVPDYACKDVTEVYVLATNDLIGKYYWMSCFGNFDMELWKTSGGKDWRCDGKNFIQIPFSTMDKQGFPIYSNGGMSVALLQNGTDLIAILNVPSQGVRNMLISDVVFYQNGEKINSKAFANNTLDGMIWIDPSFRAIIFMDSSIRDSIFTRMFFFNGEGLQKFNLMYQNPEVKIFKVNYG